ncbi:MAG TPA: HEPN domain-containing protein [Planctomycetota bacterium]|nr:HEPN domain-containing protein [Planctomycetota bacterium]
MTADERDLLEEARDSLEVAKFILSKGYPGYAASRAYYAMFYLAEAFLESEAMAFSKHKEVIATFGRCFAHTGRVARGVAQVHH